jgi:hypothetical protein
VLKKIGSVAAAGGAFTTTAAASSATSGTSRQVTTEEVTSEFEPAVASLVGMLADKDVIERRSVDQETLQDPDASSELFAAAEFLAVRNVDRGIDHVQAEISAGSARTVIHLERSKDLAYAVIGYDDRVRIMSEEFSTVELSGDLDSQDVKATEKCPGYCDDSCIGTKRQYLEHYIKEFDIGCVTYTNTCGCSV